jgi:ATP-dependent DNA ligase
MDLEGIVCKQKNSPYNVTEKPSRYWINVAALQSAVVSFYTDPTVFGVPHSDTKVSLTDFLAVLEDFARW